MKTYVVVALLITQLIGCAPTAASGNGAAPCPAGLDSYATCYEGQDSNGAYYTIAVPHDWNDTLLVHTHGGPELAEPTQDSVHEDLDEWSTFVREGYAWAGSSYRRGGYGVQMAVEDTENLRRFATDKLAPRKTYIHGQSWGGNIAAKAIETNHYDAALLTSGLLAGGSRGYNQRVDLRVVYQYYCGNHPRPDEQQYPLWQGLPPNSDMTIDDLRERVVECIGLPGGRTPEQQQKLDDILNVTRIPESGLPTQMYHATFTFQDLVNKRLGGRNPFSNNGVVYDGSRDDAALNAGVERFSANPSAQRDLAFDSDLTGRVSIPVLTMHAEGDPQVFVEHEAAYRETMRGNPWLVQVITDEDEHNGLAEDGYLTVIRALAEWESGGAKPTPQSIADSCRGTCLFNPAFIPPPYFDRVRARPGDTQWPAMSGSEQELWAHTGVRGIEG